MFLVFFLRLSSFCCLFVFTSLLQIFSGGFFFFLVSFLAEFSWNNNSCIVRWWTVSCHYNTSHSLSFSCISLLILPRGSLRFLMKLILPNWTNFDSVKKAVTFFLVYHPTAGQWLPQQDYHMQLPSMNISTLTLSKLILFFQTPNVQCQRISPSNHALCENFVLNMLLHKLIEHPSPYIVRQWINISCLSPWSICGLISLSFLFSLLPHIFFKLKFLIILSLWRETVCLSWQLLLLFWCVLIYTHTYTHRYIYTDIYYLDYFLSESEKTAFCSVQNGSISWIYTEAECVFFYYFHSLSW